MRLRWVVLIVVILVLIVSRMEYDTLVHEPKSPPNSGPVYVPIGG